MTSLAMVSSTGDVFYNITQVYEQAKADGYKRVRRALRFRLSELEDAGFLEEKLKPESYQFRKAYAKHAIQLSSEVRKFLPYLRP